MFTNMTVSGMHTFRLKNWKLYDRVNRIFFSITESCRGGEDSVERLRIAITANKLIHRACSHCDEK